MGVEVLGRRRRARSTVRLRGSTVCAAEIAEMCFPRRFFGKSRPNSTKLYAKHLGTIWDMKKKYWNFLKLLSIFYYFLNLKNSKNKKKYLKVSEIFYYFNEPSSCHRQHMCKVSDQNSKY